VVRAFSLQYPDQLQKNQKKSQKAHGIIIKITSVKRRGQQKNRHCYHQKIREDPKTGMSFRVHPYHDREYQVCWENKDP